MPEMKLKLQRERLRALTSEELHQEVAAQRANLYNFRRRNAMKQLDNTASIRVARRQIARSLTLLREREILAQKAGR